MFVCEIGVDHCLPTKLTGIFVRFIASIENTDELWTDVDQALRGS
jgi:hypothetical protein